MFCSFAYGICCRGKSITWFKIGRKCWLMSDTKAILKIEDLTVSIQGKKDHR